MNGVPYFLLKEEALGLKVLRNFTDLAVTVKEKYKCNLF
jgi:hypothetical protein